jgi:hypothetical protein
MLLKLARQEGEEFKGLGMIKLGFMNSYQPGRSMSSGFRLLLMRQIMRAHPELDYRRYQLAEGIWAVEGRVDELERPLEALSDQGVTLFFTRDQMIDWVGQSREAEFNLTALPPDDAS